MPDRPTWMSRVEKGDGLSHGMTYVMFERQGRNVRAEVAEGRRKLHADGTASITLALDQWKYGDELIAQLYTRQPTREKERLPRENGWTRIQVFLGPADLETAATLERIAARIRERKEKEPDGDGPF